MFSNLASLIPRSNASTPLGYSSSVESSTIFPDDAGYVTQSSGSLPQSRPTSRGSIKASIQAKKKKKGLGLNDSWDHDSILRSLKVCISLQMLEELGDVLCYLKVKYSDNTSLTYPYSLKDQLLPMTPSLHGL